MERLPGSEASRTPFTWSGATAARGIFSDKAELVSAIVAGILLLLGYLAHGVFHVESGAWLVWASLAIGMFYGGRAALESLREWRFDIDVLMVVGAGVAAWISRPPYEGALLLFLFVLSGALEDRAMARTKREVEALHRLMPAEAIVQRDGEWVAAAPETLAVGERVRIRPGDRVPTDARVVSGRSSMDQSAITGESMPREVEAGDELYAGTINTDDPIEAEVMRPVGESSLARILNLVTQAREQREPVQRVIDRLSQPYAIGVMVVSVIVAIVWWLWFEVPLTGGEGEPGALYTAITLLIVASPCALIIATPTATLAAIARGARAGVLFKGGQAIERLASTGAVCFDKTGTLTFGRPRVYEVHPVAWSDGAELLSIAAGIEAYSSHPIASAIREIAAQRAVEPVEVTDYDHVAGRGVAAKYHGCPVRLGSYRFTEELIPVCFRSRVREVLEKIQERGHLGVVVVHACPEKAGGGEAAVIIMADAVRPGARTLVDELHALDIRPVRMLTGDNRLTAERVAGSLGLDAFDAELLPEDKVRIVRSMRAADGAGSANAPGDSARLWRRNLQSRGTGVTVIGDGVNDAPALAAADASVAIGSIGSEAALESADIVLLSDDLAVVPWAIRLARRARAIVKANLVFAISVIVVMGAATLVGSRLGRPVPLSLGVLAHEGGTLLVVFNSLRLLWASAPKAGPHAEAPPARTASGRRIASPA